MDVTSTSGVEAINGDNNVAVTVVGNDVIVGVALVISNLPDQLP